MEILNTSKICRIALFDSPYPYIVPMNYGYADNQLYFHCAKEGKKIELIKSNNKVCFEIEQSHEIIADDVSCKWSTKYQSIIGFGTIELLTDLEEKRKGLDTIMIQHGKKDNAYKDSALDKVMVLKLNIDNLTGKQSD